jgi:predicted O-linked N-acetylglucosamine transferase (SPINDLY family)
VGYVSSHFATHPHVFFLTPLLRNQDREHFEVFCYSDVTVPDEGTASLRALSDQWRETATLDADAFEALVRKDRIDVLVDLDMHTAGNRLLAFARKAAPVQICWLAYPGTTGLTAMDYRITDSFLDPPDGQPLPYSEESLWLPHAFWCYDPLTEPLEVGPPPADSRGAVTFGCLNDASKLNQGVLHAWGSLLSQVPGSRLVVLSTSPESRVRIAESLARYGVDEQRLEVVARLPRVAYLEVYKRIDVCVDPFPCGGHTTTFDALWMGVPVVTLRSEDRIVGRGGASIAANLGLTELVASTPEAYVRIAAELALDLPRLRELRASLRERLTASPLMDGPGFARDLGALFRRAWRRWCEVA